MPAQPPLYGRQLLVAGDVGHDRSDQRAVPGQHGLDRHRPAVDPLHDLELDAGELVLAGRGVPTVTVGDEEGGLARVTPWQLHDQVVAEPGRVRGLEQLVVALDGAQHVGHARHPGLVAHPGGDQLGVHPVPQLGRGQRDLDVQLGRQPLGLGVEHHQHGLAAGALGAHQVVELGVGQQVVVHLLHRGEVVVAAVLRDEHPRVRAGEGVVVVDVGEVGDPAVHPEQVERGRRDEVDRCLVAAEERPDRRHPAQRLAPGSGGGRRGRRLVDGDVGGFGRHGGAGLHRRDALLGAPAAGLAAAAAALGRGCLAVGHCCPFGPGLVRCRVALAC